VGAAMTRSQVEACGARIASVLSSLAGPLVVSALVAEEKL
jgi:hypothetical protein